jgi:CRISPR-associated protein Csb3
MNERHEIKIDVNALNPFEYLACCGIFEIASRFDETALTHWQSGDTTTFALESVVSEKELFEIILSTLTDWNKWKVIANDAKEVIRLEASFSGANDQTEKFIFDWWYESLTQEGRINKSGWKMYAGQQKAEKITLDMIQKCQKLHCENLSEILQQTSKVSGSFGFDPMASRNALDVGYSPNDLNLSVVTNPFSQLLAMFGAQNFFSTRTKQANEIVSSRGWMKENRRYFFDYSLWLMPVPIALARILANAPTQVPENKTVNLRSARATRDKYSNLTLSSPTNSRGEKL